MQQLVAFCRNDACRHQALIEVSGCPAETEVPCRVKCGKCGGRGNKIDVRPSWKEQLVLPTKLQRINRAQPLSDSHAAKHQKDLYFRNPTRPRVNAATKRVVP